MTFDELLRKESFTEKEVEEFREACYSVASPHFLIELLDSVEHRFCDPVIKTQAIQAMWSLLIEIQRWSDYADKHRYDDLFLYHVDELRHYKEDGEDKYLLRFKHQETFLDSRMFERYKQSLENNIFLANKIREE